MRIDIPELSVVDANATALMHGISPAQICRSCVFQSKRFHLVSVNEIKANKAKGNPTEVLKCQPDQFGLMRKALVDGSVMAASTNAGLFTESKQMNDKGEVRVEITTKPKRKTAALVESCGQQILDKCKGCARLERYEVETIGGYKANGRPWYRKVLVGGYCTIPEEGIEVHGRHGVKCDRKPLPPREREISCFTCGNCQTFAGPWMSNHGVINQIDLTAYEMEQARRGAEEGKVGLAIWAGRQIASKVPMATKPGSKKITLTTPGLRKFYAADVLEVFYADKVVQDAPATFKRTMLHHIEEQNGRRVSIASWFGGPVMTSPPQTHVEGRQIVAYRVNFRGLGDSHIIEANSSDDTKGIVHPTAQTNRVVVELQTPWHRQYGLPDGGESTARRIFEWAECPQCHGESTKRKALWNQLHCSRCSSTGKVPMLHKTDTSVHVDDSDLVDPSCPRCMDRNDNKPCYFHGKDLRELETEEGVEMIFFNPKLRALGRARTSEQREQVIARYNAIFEESRCDDPVRMLKLMRSGMGVRVQDANGDDPTPEAFQFALWGLYRQARNDVERQAILAQWITTCDDAHIGYGKPFPTELNLTRFMSEEPWKPTCTLHMADPSKGIDLRAAFGDWFGDPRSVQSTNPLHDRIVDGRVRGKLMDAGTSYFSWAKAMSRETWDINTNPGERVQEEFMANLFRLRAERAGRPGFDQFGNRLHEFTMPADAEVIEVTMRGDIDDTQDFANWLEGFCVHGLLDCTQCPEPNRMVQIPISDTGEVIEVTPRWQIYGYEIRGRMAQSKKRKTSNNEARAGDMVTFNHDPDEAGEEGVPNRKMGFWCSAPSCDAFYAVDEINDEENPTCTRLVFIDEKEDVYRTCGAPLIWYEQDREWNQGASRVSVNYAEEPWRRIGSPTLAGGQDSTYWQQRGRLMDTVCEHWVPKPWVNDQRPLQTNQNTDGHEQLDWTGKQIDVEIGGERMQFIIDETISRHAPLIEALIASRGAPVLRYRGGWGDVVEAKVLSIA